MRAGRGGDWCETFAISENHIALSIGDISGHGIDEYDLMVAVRKVIHDAVLRGLSPMCALAEANRFLCINHPKKTATALLAFLNTDEQSLIFANAGHPAPLMANTEKTSFLEFPESDMLLGIDIDAKTKIRIIDVPPSTLLVLYTDGVSEHRKDAIQGEHELFDAVTLAYRSTSFPKADIIEKTMFLSGLNTDDVSILTAFTE